MIKKILYHNIIYSIVIPFMPPLSSIKQCVNTIYMLVPLCKHGFCCYLISFDWNRFSVMQMLPQAQFCIWLSNCFIHLSYLQLYLNWPATMTDILKLLVLFVWHWFNMFAFQKQRKDCVSIETKRMWEWFSH